MTFRSIIETLTPEIGWIFFPLLCIEVLRGVIVALELVSETTTSAFVAGALVGLNAAFLVGLMPDATGALVA